MLARLSVTGHLVKAVSAHPPTCPRLGGDGYQTMANASRRTSLEKGNEGPRGRTQRTQAAAERGGIASAGAFLWV